ncbi:MAG: Phosphoribosylformylglycinamidine cyclo-ligase [Ferruginibacter sp.]|uniref:AIR synthase related protein n=1 Tax=Ferruginibacter sp. TaxID=1940288 RepID=UPI0026584812|nr:AIR synthase related protein [Ferruginibacter sp.]MDB5277602.1 Phosphoribosylformylglycinamidine cyclo-ligase [Ferruginibacter sp.]
MSLYSKRGVSAQKEEVHAATKHLDQGLFANAFCKIYPDYLGGDDDYVSVMHADGAGTKSILAYLYWKETGDIAVWKGIAQDAIVMNLDDLLCVGVYDNIVFNSTIDRNKTIIPGEVLSQVINGSQQLFDELKSFGVHIHYLGGETADVGDVVRTIAVNGTMTCRFLKSKVISNDKIKAGDVIVGLASYGQATYETEYNSGIGSNGLTSARHDVLSKYYADNFKESYNTSLDEAVVYIGNNKLSDAITFTIDNSPFTTTVGKLILSPTRTYAPVLKVLLENEFDKIHGLIHCSGGGQTKCMKYLPETFRIVKDNLFEAPEIFKLIQKSSGSNNREMYEVFNMGCRLEIYCAAQDAELMISTAKTFNIDAQVIGRVEANDKKELVIKLKDETIVY